MFMNLPFMQLINTCFHFSKNKIIQAHTHELPFGLLLIHLNNVLRVCMQRMLWLFRSSTNASISHHQNMDHSEKLS